MNDTNLARTDAANRAPLILMQGVTKRLGRHTALSGLDLALFPGECLGIIGPNGAGKTTTTRILLGLLTADAGQVTAFGLEQPTHAQRVRKRLGVVGQFDTLDPDFNCRENILTYGRYFGLSDAEIEKQIPDLLAFAELTHKAHARIDELSGGMKRRLSLARSLVNDPDVLILDEPTTGLDPQARHVMWERLGALRKRGKAIILTTHFMEEAERLCDRVMVMDHGQKIAEGSPKALIAAEVEPHVVEVQGLQTDSERADIAMHADRVEVSGESTFFYSRAPHALLQALEARPGLRVLHRPADLEDVFLKFTGREIREAA